MRSRPSAQTSRMATPSRCSRSLRRRSSGGSCRARRSPRRCAEVGGSATSSASARRSRRRCGRTTSKRRQRSPAPTGRRPLSDRPDRAPSPPRSLQLEEALSEHFEQHPDAKIVRSLPGLGTVLGARVLGEFGDDRTRFASPKSRKNYAGTSPMTKASGRSHVVLARYARNRRLADALDQWAFCSLTHLARSRRYYDELRGRGKTHRQALRQLANRWVGILHPASNAVASTTKPPPGHTASSA